MLVHIENKTSYIVCKYLGTIIGFTEQFTLSDLDRIELLMDLEESYNIQIDQAVFNKCNTIQEIEELLLISKHK